tara:strand:- start:55 stop:636 length:582 start_codon:yes stop_codon:yes gene_type:complete
MGFRKWFMKKKNLEDSESYFAKSNFTLLTTPDLYLENTIDKISSYNLDVILLIGNFGIIREPLISLVPKGILSYHHGDMRKYRGMPPAFWELYNGESEMGLTVQRLSSKLDLGSPIVEKKVKIKANDSLSKLKKRAYFESKDMMYTALNKISKSRPIESALINAGKIYTLPNLKQWLILNFKVFFRKIKVFLK